MPTDIPGTNWTYWTHSDQLHLTHRTNRRPSARLFLVVSALTSYDYTAPPLLTSSSSSSPSSSSSSSSFRCGLDPYLSSLRPHIHLTHRPGRLLANPSHRDWRTSA
ncbi:hypothetical protein SprV_0100138400 [Sparganum proliferum]